MGYDCEWQVLNSKSTGATKQERVFIIANIRGERRLKYFLSKKAIEWICASISVSALRYGINKMWEDALYQRASKTEIKRTFNTRLIECERLQGFPDNWTKYGIDKNGEEVLISDSQRYKMCGNAVTTNVITEIGKRLAQGVLL